MPSNLDREWAAYIASLPELQMQSGKFVLIKGDEVAGIFDSYRDALKAGYERFRLEPFLVKQIAVVEKALQFSREHALQGRQKDECGSTRARKIGALLVAVDPSPAD